MDKEGVFAVCVRFRGVILARKEYPCFSMFIGCIGIRRASINRPEKGEKGAAYTGLHYIRRRTTKKVDA